MIYPGDYIVWNYTELGLELNYLHNEKGEIPNPNYLDLDEIQKWNDEFLILFNKNNTKFIFFIEYYGSPGFEVNVLVIKPIDEEYEMLKNKLKNKKFKSRKEQLFFDNENKVILNVGSIDDLGHNKASEICGIISKNLPSLEKYSMFS